MRVNYFKFGLDCKIGSCALNLLSESSIEAEEEAGGRKGELLITLFWHSSVNMKNFTFTKVFENIHMQVT